MRTSNFYIFLLILILVAACDKPMSNPELKDPIYLDLISSADKTKKEIDSKLKDYSEYEEELSGYPDNHFEKKITRENMKNTKVELDLLGQKLKYFKISAESRQIFARKQYLEYYKAGKDWPPENSFELYSENKKTMENYRKTWMRGLASEINRLKDGDSKTKKKESAGH